MNLNTAIDLHTPGKNESLTIEAGGPGSGRHKEMDSHLKQNGFEHQGYWGDKKAGTSSHHYYNSKSDTTVTVDKEGNWTSRKGVWGKETNGKGLESFKSQNKTVKAGVSGGGPGSGPQGGRGLSPEMADLAKREGRKLRVMHPHQPSQPKISLTPKLSVPGRLYKGGPAPKLGANPKLARPAAGGTGRAHGIRGGGPGSGRHKEFLKNVERKPVRQWGDEEKADKERRKKAAQQAAEGAKKIGMHKSAAFLTGIAKTGRTLSSSDFARIDRIRDRIENKADKGSVYPDHSALHDYLNWVTNIGRGW